MKIYGSAGSTCTRKVLTVFAEKNQTPEFVSIDFNKGEHKSPEHMARQPFGQVPALEDDGFWLYESRAICRYLDEKLGGLKLVPSDLKTRATMEQWVSIETSNFTPHAMKIIYAALLGPMRGAPVDQAKVDEGRKGLTNALEVMDRQLSKTPFFTGSEFTLADIGFMPYIEYLYACKNGDVIETYPAVLKWWKGVSDRRSWQVATGKAS
jgi:glutathione S-transferase